MEGYLSFPLGDTGQGSQVAQLESKWSRFLPVLLPVLSLQAAPVAILFSPGIDACRIQRPSSSPPTLCPVAPALQMQMLSCQTGHLCLQLFIVTAFCAPSLTPPDDNCHSSLPTPPNPLPRISYHHTTIFIVAVIIIIIIILPLLSFKLLESQLSLNP